VSLASRQPRSVPEALRGAPWTIALCAVLLGLNWRLFTGEAGGSGGFIELLELDRRAVLAGEVWRLLGGSLVHWSAAHFLLDAGAFLAVGLLFERRLGRAYPWILLASALAVGLSIFVVAPQVACYRGLSGADSGQFAAALACELAATRGRPLRERFLAGAAALVFALKLAYEVAAGRMFFGTEALGDIGLPLPLSHVAGVAGALAAVGVAASLRRSGRAPPSGRPRHQRPDPQRQQL
jgi:rhomboid family GlyGly-CTERM serine protease